jgi:hypothetical protein
VCKLGWWDGAPWDVLAYASGHSTFPCDGTLQQLYDVTEFEAYHQLGVASAAGATQHCDPPLKQVAGAAGAAQHRIPPLKQEAHVTQGAGL